MIDSKGWLREQGESSQGQCVTTDLGTLATARYVKADDLLKASPQFAPWRPKAGIFPQLSDAELVTLSVMQALPDGQWPADPAGEHPPVPGMPARDAALGRGGGWLQGSRGDMAATALLVGAGSGLGAAAFRCLIYFFTWLATGHGQFGQQGRVGSSHLAFLGAGFLVVIPVIGGLVYGPLIYRYAREARGHGVPEVMIAVAEDDGRIRPQVAAAKALASALCSPG